MPKYDKALEVEVIQWMEDATGVEVDLDGGDLMDFLKSGVYLCSLLNALRPNTVKKVSSKKHAIFQIENIKKFMDNVTSFGLRSYETFTTSDLFEKANPSAVLMTLAALKRHTMPGGPGAGSRPGPKPGPKFHVETGGGLWGKAGSEHRASNFVRPPAPAPAPVQHHNIKVHHGRGYEYSGANFHNKSISFAEKEVDSTEEAASTALPLRATQTTWPSHAVAAAEQSIAAQSRWSSAGIKVSATVRMTKSAARAAAKAAAEAEAEARAEEQETLRMEAELQAAKAEIAALSPKTTGPTRPATAPGHAYGSGGVKNNYGSGEVRVARPGEQVTRGLDADLRKKMAAKYKPDDVEEVKQYIADWTGEYIEGDLIEGLHSGVKLCQLANAISPRIVKKVSTKSIPIFQIENISKFIDAARKLGVTESSLFGSASLWERKNPSQVVLTLLALKRVHPYGF